MVAHKKKWPVPIMVVFLHPHRLQASAHLLHPHLNLCPHLEHLHLNQRQLQHLEHRYNRHTLKSKET
jgi:hypothetical protein